MYIIYYLMKFSPLLFEIYIFSLISTKRTQLYKITEVNQSMRTESKFSKIKAKYSWTSIYVLNWSKMVLLIAKST